MEGSVTTNEFYYLILVLGGFGAFAAAMALATIQYRAWRRHAVGPRVTPSIAAGVVDAD
jgi:hypothetical protein